MSWLLSLGLAGKKGPSKFGPRTSPIVARCLRRARATAPQSGLTLSARRENVRGVFQVVKPKLVRDRVVVLVDDVMTTGATVSACAAALKRAGARSVIALTLARATPLFPDIAMSAVEGSTTADRKPPE